MTPHTYRKRCENNVAETGINRSRVVLKFPLLDNHALCNDVYKCLLQTHSPYMITRMPNNVHDC